MVGPMQPEAGAPGAGDVRRHVESYGVSHVGKVRAANEDHFVIASIQRSLQVRQTNLEDRGVFDRLCGPQAYLFAVADGVGGVAGGRQASGMTMETIVEYLSETVGTYHALPVGQEHDFLDPLRHAAERAHRRLLETFRSRGHAGPATTLTMALLVWPRAFVVHVGGSRAYHLHAGQLRRLTRDQTVGAHLVAQQAMSEQEAEQAGLNKMLTSAVGASDMAPAIGVIELAAGDLLLLCTDGLTNHVAEGQLAEILGRPVDVETTSRQLLELALAGGGRDNITVVVARALAP